MKALIGLSGVYDPQSGNVRVRNLYMERVYAAGGLPVLLPLLLQKEPITALSERLDGLLLTGGGDITPRYYGQDLQTAYDETEPERDAFELELFDRMLLSNKPILGICRGAQLIAVACGAQLLQQVRGHSGGISHDVDLCDCMLKKICDCDRVRVNSYHMQAVAEFSSNLPLAVCARADDGTIEGVVHNTHPFCLGVQWHPERITYSASASDNIFSAFVSACSR